MISFKNYLPKTFKTLEVNDIIWANGYQVRIIAIGRRRDGLSIKINRKIYFNDDNGTRILEFCSSGEGYDFSLSCLNISKGFILSYNSKFCVSIQKPKESSVKEYMKKACLRLHKDCLGKYKLADLVAENLKARSIYEKTGIKTTD